jgi:hypothetical protein
VWIGSGFGDDGGAEGELGCSDVPGLVDSFMKSGAALSPGINPGDGKSATTSAKFRSKRDISEDGPFTDRTSVPSDLLPGKDIPEPYVDDGTDDYLHQSLVDSAGAKPTDPRPADSESNHADIQSIQEGAEIAGKVVLLSRGGCGFLEKVKWAQRRGAIALIVGDDTKGGVLIQMYARGDTSNVTIPSIFTSRTTAHLLSTLIGVGNYMEDSNDGNGGSGLKVPNMVKPKKAKKISSPTFTPTVGAPRSTATPRIPSRFANKIHAPASEHSTAMTTEKPGWFKALFFGIGKGKAKEDNSRPPSSGQLDWVLVDDWKDEDSLTTKKVSTPKSDSKTAGKKTFQKSKGSDDFVIGVQDWRDPDLVGSSGKDNESGGKGTKGGSASMTKLPTLLSKSGKKHTGGALQDIPEWTPPLRGGSITPSSGEYVGKDSQEDMARAKEENTDSAAEGGKSKSLMTAIFGDDEEDVELLSPDRHSTQETIDNDVDDEYEGLWVTLTPTSGASPFLDTLLVLVVSPLVTLTVVYALLLIRSRIRRRRWRAPKSVVERLPVRTYQTIATSGSQSPRLPSPTSSSASTPLLRNSSTRSRPRSRTTTGIPEQGDLDRVNSQPLQVPSIQPRSPEPEKNSSVSSEWKKYMGKQVECVVCLEEYLDGVSRVMSLPCGHEFHVDCM